jgi:hypothetical protein
MICGDVPSVETKLKRGKTEKKKKEKRNLKQVDEIHTAHRCQSQLETTRPWSGNEANAEDMDQEPRIDDPRECCIDSLQHNTCSYTSMLQTVAGEHGTAARIESKRAILYRAWHSARKLLPVLTPPLSFGSNDETVAQLRKVGVWQGLATAQCSLDL